MNNSNNNIYFIAIACSTLEKLDLKFYVWILSHNFRDIAFNVNASYLVVFKIDA